MSKICIMSVVNFNINQNFHTHYFSIYHSYDHNLFILIVNVYYQLRIN